VAGSRKISVVGKIALMLFLWLMIIKSMALAQCTTQVRVYAAEQEFNAGLLTSVTNPTNAADGNATTFSQLNTLLGLGVIGNVTQFLRFNNPVTPGTSISAGTPVTVKLSLPAGLLSLLTGVEVQPFKSLHDGGIFGGGWQATAVGPSVTGATLLGLLGGVGDQDITFSPSVDYDGVWVRISGISVAQSIKLYEGFIMQTASANAACNVPMDVLSGVKPLTGIGSIGTVLGTTLNPELAIDTDPNSYAEIDAVGSVLSSVYHTTLFNSLSQAGDTVKMVVQNTGAGLLDVGILNGFSIQFYNGTTKVGSAIAGSSNNLHLALFPGSSVKYELDVSPPASDGPFDRVEVSIGGLATLSVIQGLKIYDVKRVIATPSFGSLASSTKSVCEGNTDTFTITNSQLCTNYNWYDAATGGNLLQSGASNIYTPPTNLTSGNYTYYVSANRIGCSETNTRTPVTFKVNPLPGVATTSHPKICAGTTSTTFTYTTTNAPQTYSIVWDSAAHTANFVDVTNQPLPTGDITVAVPANAPPATYNGVLTVKNANGCISSTQPISVVVDPTASQPVINLTP
jgi:hypothetical protein